MYADITGILIFVFASPVLWVSSGILGRTSYSALDYLWLAGAVGVGYIVSKLLKKAAH